MIIEQGKNKIVFVDEAQNQLAVIIKPNHIMFSSILFFEMKLDDRKALIKFISEGYQAENQNTLF